MTKKPSDMTSRDAKTQDRIMRALGGDPVGLFREFVAGELQAKSKRKSPAK
jgi:hypothetical protein